VIRRSAGRYRELGLDDAAFARSGRALERALRGGRRLTRQAAYAAIERGGVSAEGQRGIHIIGHLAQRGLVCFGPREGRQPTFVLLDEWVPASPAVPRGAALAALATRYFASHGPATAHDFAWWSGLPLEDARAGIETAGSRLVKETIDGRSWWSAPSSPARTRAARTPVAALLPPWDEYVVAYIERAAALGHLPQDDARVKYAVGQSLVLVDGRVVGAWRRTLAPATVRVSVEPWSRVTAAERRAVAEATARYARFQGRRLEGGD
jgi:hypothetical protein